MRVILEILRFDPESGEKPGFRRYPVDLDPGERLLDGLLSVKERMEPGLAFRKSCGHGVCGSDAMIVDGKERLACKTLVKEVASGEGAVIRIEPLRNLPVQRDLMVDAEPFFGKYRAVKPYLIEASAPPDRERLQTPAERLVIEDAIKCILCAACYSACPVVQRENPRFLGPAASVQAYRFLTDSRDRGPEERRDVLGGPDGLAACRNYFECTRVCPRSIKVTRLINAARKRMAVPGA
jgi:succinate dehydrogenase / fumarate reductase, iron-sulfur subunit